MVLIIGTHFIVSLLLLPLCRTTGQTSEGGHIPAFPRVYPAAVRCHTVLSFPLVSPLTPRLVSTEGFPMGLHLAMLINSILQCTVVTLFSVITVTAVRKQKESQNKNREHSPYSANAV
jgi:hypothetical protein